MKQKYDYYLIVLTTLIFLAIGLVCVYGITYYNYLALNPEWISSIQYSRYINEINSYLYPFLVMLLISLGLCIPKRLFEQHILIKFSAILLGITLVLSFIMDIEAGLGFILAVITGVQGIVLILTLIKSKAMRFEKEGYVVRLGSSLLHLGVVILIFNFVVMRENTLHVLIFWIGTTFMSAGNVFSFYSEKIKN